MKWYKHDTNAWNDAKIRKLLRRYGATGYAVYFHCLELIASDVEQDNITFELEHDSEVIAENLRIQGTSGKAGADIVNEIMRYIVELDLFQQSQGKIYGLKLLRRLDTSMTSNSKLRGLIQRAKQHESEMLRQIEDNHDVVMTESCKTRTDETRIDNNAPKIGEYEDDFNATWKHYPRKVEKKAAYKAYRARRNEGELYDTLFTATLNYKKQVEKEQRSMQYVKQGKSFYGPNQPYLDYVGTSEPDEPEKPTYVAACKQCGTHNTPDAHECSECGSRELVMKRSEVAV